MAGEPDLAAIGVTVSTGGANTIRIKVGVKNVGVNPWFSPNRHSVIAYVHVPRNTWGESASYACAGWGPYPDGWGWEDPGRASYQYACRAGLLNPGDTAWFELTLAVDANKPVAPGDITVVEGAESNPANDTGTILVSTASLPVTGTRTWQIGALGGGLLALGALLLLGAHRRKGPVLWRR